MMSDMQFSFKPQHSTLVCGLFYKGTIRNYLQHCNNVYSCLLDASKAFDQVHYGKLFNVLIEKQVPFSIILYFLDSYIRQRIRVLWNNCTSMYVTISNGVKQGGVLSPTLFSIYINRLLKVLRIATT